MAMEGGIYEIVTWESTERYVKYLDDRREYYFRMLDDLERQIRQIRAWISDTDEELDAVMVAMNEAGLCWNPEGGDYIQEKDCQHCASFQYCENHICDGCDKEGIV